MSVSYDHDFAEDSYAQRFALVKSDFKAQLAAKENALDFSDQDLPGTRTADVICRICFEAETSSNTFIAPCLCTGSVKYMHEECLKTWIVSQSGDCSVCACELCGYVFKMEFTIRLECSTNHAFTEGLSQCLFIPMMVIVLGMMCMILFLLVDKYVTDQIEEERGYLAMLFITCFISLLVILYLIIQTFKEACCLERIEAWQILSRPHDAVVNPQAVSRPHKFSPLTDDPTGIETFNLFKADQPHVMVIPEKVRFRGRLVATPLLEPSLPALTQREGKSKVFGTPALQSSMTARESTMRVQRTSRVNISDRSAVSEIRD
jgi:hypothetical protein